MHKNQNRPIPTLKPRWDRFSGMGRISHRRFETGRWHKLYSEQKSSQNRGTIDEHEGKIAVLREFADSNRPVKTHNAATRNQPPGGVGINPDSAIPR
jgi:hypothetical protein